MHELITYISDGATAFLLAEYRFMFLFCLAMSGCILLLIGPTVEGWDAAIFSTLAFILGATTSVASGSGCKMLFWFYRRTELLGCAILLLLCLAGWIGMRIAVYSNGRTTVTAAKGYAEGLSLFTLLQLSCQWFF